MTAVICIFCGGGDDLGDGGYEIDFDWDRSMCMMCQAENDICACCDCYIYYEGNPFCSECSADIKVQDV